MASSRLLQQRIDVEEKRREEAIEQLTSFMTEAITTVSNRMEELALTHLKSQQQQDSAMQGLTQRLIEVQESDNAQIHQLKQLDEIQSGATQQISRIEAKHQELFHGLNELSSETKTCIGQLNEAVRGILEDAGALERLRKRASQSLQREDDQDTLADTIKTDSDRTVLPAGSLERSPRIAAIRTLSPQPMQTWQMRASVPAKPGKTANSKQEALQALQTADSQSRVDNSRILTPRVDNSLPATERARRVTSPTRNEAK
ncbi:unnamed protein product [Durusdinium trenchii]|uniref:Uncharacterized protein n=1 Tax=Durusdinium trenchii TaxID=1381693 RepID=A0ABP0Q603_9DINO